MRPADFRLERYFARYEFCTKYLLASSDAESFRVDELLGLAQDDAAGRALWDDLRLGYTEAPGHPLLRAEIAALYQGFDADDVLVFGGAEEAIFAFASVSFGAGDHVIVTWPAYQSLHEIAGAAGADVTLLRLRRERGWEIDVDELRASLRPSTRCVIINAPHNPTGMLPDRPTFEAAAALCAQRGIRLFVDEVFRYGEIDASARLPAAAETAASNVSLGGLAKPFGLSGLRIGWIATRDRALLDRLARFKDYLTICCSAPSEILAIIALRAKDRVLARNRAIAAANLALLDDFFSRSQKRFDWVRPRAGPIAFPRLLASMSIEDFAARLVEEAGVMILPASVFAHDGNHFRVGFGRKDMPEALQRMEAFADRVL